MLDKPGKKHYMWGPFNPLPNVSEFSVKLRDFDPLFKEYGIKKKTRTKICLCKA